MNNAILHISDLHFVLQNETRQVQSRYDQKFQDTLLTYLKNIKDLKIKYLIVTGDIADKSNEAEYNTALKFLNELVNQLSLQKKNIIICPGNHDIHWPTLDNLIASENIDDALIHTKQSEKFVHFIKFYNSFFEKEKKFDAYTAIFDKIIDEEDKIIFLGINTCYRESNYKEDHIGYINKELFEKELKDLSLEGYSGFGKILAMHHNPKDLSSAKQHHLENWKELNIAIDLPYIILCGHIHGQDGEILKRNDGSISYISTGTLTKNTLENTFNIYSDLNKKEITIDYYALQAKENPSRSFWQKLTNISVSRTKADFRSDSQTVKVDHLDILLNDYGHTVQQDLDRKLRSAKEYNKSTSRNLKIDNEIINFIKDRNLFKSGHFHWKNGFRSHGFIDINNLVSHKDSLESITKLFYDKIIETMIPIEEAIIIAVGIECNIIGARLSVIFDSAYSYIPEPRKESDFSKIEKSIKLDYKYIILLKDIIFTADHSKELINSIESNDKLIYVFSLFYCGQRSLKNSIFSEYNNVHFYSICDDIIINQCDYSGEENNINCPIFKNKLEVIYDEC